MTQKTRFSPPKLAKRLLLSFLRDDLVEEVCGDLEEKFYASVKNRSRLRAKLNYWYQVLNYMRPFAMRKSKSTYLDHYAMFQNYFKIGWRNLLKQKMYSSIKIGGFALGLAACFLIGLFIKQELEYDLHYPRKDRIYRVFRESVRNGELRKQVWFPAPMASVLQEDYPEIEKAGHYLSGSIFGGGGNEIRPSDEPENTHEEGFAYMDQALLEILEIPFRYGSPGRALVEPNTIVITKRKADKYFPGENPIGKSFILNNNEGNLLKVSGVIEDFPVTSHLQCDFILSLSGREFWPGEQTDWRGSNYFDYVLVQPGTDIALLEKKLSSITERYYLPAAIEAGGDADEIGWINSLRIKLQPVTDIYLNRYGIGDDLNHGDMRYVWLFGSIAGFILLMASINFINLSTARSAYRAKEVGLRKVVGSVRTSLIKQFLTESLIYSLASFVLGLLLAWLLLPYFNLLLSKSLIFPWRETWLLPVLLTGALVVGALAGLYPAFYLSSFKPIQALKGSVLRVGKASATRSFLVVFQFTISIALIVGTIVIDRQMDYILTKDLGYDKEQVLILQGTRTLDDRIVTFRDELLRLPGVKSASISGFFPVEGTRRNGNDFWKDVKTDASEAVNGQRWFVDPDYVETIGLRIVSGRDFSANIASDSQAIVINQAMAKGLNLNDPIGQRLTSGWETWTVIGVIEDFHFESLRNAIEPLSLVMRRDNNAVAVKVSTTDMQGVIAAISKVWKEFSRKQPIRYTFLDQSYARMYEDVKRTGLIFTSFAVLAVVVACLGLLALSTFLAEQRGKEISIRLVLGASLGSIFNLLTRNFLKLVLISFVLAVPIAWYMMQKWLEDYVYKIEIGWDLFVFAGLIAVCISLATISYQSIKAALTNPVNGLRAE
jgi:putative ABC transport system permease protein